MRTNVALRMAKMRAKLASKDLDTARTNYALGVLTTIEWLLSPTGNCPYPDILEDLGEGEGWEEQGTLAPAPAPPRVSPVVAAPTVVAATPVQQFTEEPQPTFLLDANGDPVVPPDVLAAASNPKAVEAPKLSNVLIEHPWLRRELESVGITGYQPGDHNTVVVGSGLGDGPVLGGDY